MWINKEVNIPEALVTAQREGRLVVFAGAGVSMGPPSNLPSFEQLADQVSAGTLVRIADEPFDLFLGRLEIEVDVQARTRGIINAPASRPNQLHSDLVELFGSLEHIRIVTTNFDSHFSTVARTKFSDPLDIYFAPALPLGRDFAGIVYLHGSVLRTNPLVLTDADFGRAYLADGWATRFLMEMFATFAVLFIGYKHEDAVMRYLARGFVGKSERFALSADGDDSRWKHLGITPVPYPKRAAPDEYGALPEAIRAWSARAKMGLLDHDRRIKEIVQSPPLFDPDVADYMESVIRQPTTLQFFVQHAKGTEWLAWAEERGAFDLLFSATEPSGEREMLIATWFAATYALQHPQEALDLVQRHEMRLSGMLWHAIAWQLARAKSRPTPDVLAPWLVILTNRLAAGWSTNALSHLLSECRNPEEATCSLILFERLASPLVKLSPPWPGVDDETERPRLRVELKLHGEDYQLRKAWTDFFLPQMDKLHHALRPIVVAHLTRAYLLSAAAGEAWGNWDPLSFGRSAIEPHGQDRYPADWEFLVDAARDVLDWLIAREPVQGRALIDDWRRSPFSLFKRLAIHGLATDPGLDTDAALGLIEAEHWLYPLHLKHEVFRLLEHVFGNASKRAQKRFIAYSMKAPVLPKEVEQKDATESKGISDYERYNVAAWLHRVAPASSAARDHLERLQRTHKEFRPREHPDFDHWASGVETVVPRGPKTPDELLALEPAQHLAWLLSYDPKPALPGEADRGGLLQAVTTAASTSFAWSWKLVKTLADHGEWATDLWRSVIWGWKEAKLEPAQTEDVLRLLIEHPAPDPRTRRAMVDLLEPLVDEKQGTPTEAILTSVEHLTDRLMEMPTPRETVEAVGREDWLFKAVNQLGGRIALVRLKVLSRRRGQATDWQGLPEEYRRRLEEMVSGDGVNQEFARAVLASQVHFLFSLDPKWTVEHVLPLFDWSRAPRTAQQAWHGFLGWGRWNDALFGNLLPYFTQSFARLSTELVDVREAFAQRAADFAAHSTLDPWHGGWLFDFIRDADVDSRVQWASSFDRVLRLLDPGLAAQLWDKWISDYWADRATGVPKSLSEGEAGAMLTWCLGLGLRLDEVVNKVLSTAAPPSVDGSVFYELEQSGVSGSHPATTTRLLKHILTVAARIDYSCDTVFRLAKSALDSGASHAELRSVAESMARLGCSQGRDLRALLE